MDLKLKIFHISIHFWDTVLLTMGLEKKKRKTKVSDALEHEIVVILTICVHFCLWNMMIETTQHQQYQELPTQPQNVCHKTLEINTFAV